MAYTKQGFKDGDVLSAAQLEAMEDGILEVQPVAKTEEMTQAVGVDANGGLWALPGGGEWELAINQQIAEDCNQVVFDTTDNGKQFSRYKELMVFIDLRGNSADVKTHLKVSFLRSDQIAWYGTYTILMNAYPASETKYYFTMKRFVKTPYGVYPAQAFNQYNQTTMSNQLRLAGNSGIDGDFSLPIGANSYSTLEMTTFAYATEFERVAIGSYVAAIGAGTIIKIWGYVE